MAIYNPYKNVGFSKNNLIHISDSTLFMANGIFIIITMTVFRFDKLVQNINVKSMKLSARNQLKGVIKSIEDGLITSKVVIDLGGGNEIVSIISKQAIKELELKPGKDAYAIVKSTEVIVGVDE